MDQTPDDVGDDGFTLIELIVYCLLLVLVVSVVGGVLISAQTSERTVRSVTAASTQSQLIADSIGTGIRNASDFEVRDMAEGDQLLLARVAVGATSITWTCAAWYYDSSAEGSMRYTRSTGRILEPSQRDLDGWTLLGEGVQQVSGATIFDQTGSTLKVEFTGSTDDSAPVAITSSTASRLGTAESEPCF